MDKLNIPKLLLGSTLLIGGWCGYQLHGYLHSCPVPEPVTKVEYRDRVETVVRYVPKAAEEKADIDMQLGKQELIVKVNDKVMQIDKADNESYVFDKNKLTLQQESTATLNINVPVVDKTRRWGIGIGLHGTKPVGIVEAPLKGNTGLWLAGNKDDVMAGVVFKF